MDGFEALRQAVLGLAEPVFVVLDGAQFADLPASLAASDLTHRSLYLDRGDNHPERLATAPRMAALPEDRHREAAVDLLREGSGSAGVFWTCPAGGDRLYRHLRRLNRVHVPVLTDADYRDVAGSASPVPSMPDDPTSFPLFRHADANVMAQMKLGLEPETIATLLGPAPGIVFLAGPEWSGLQRISHPDPFGGDRGATLRLRKDEALALAETRLLVFDRSLADALRSARPELDAGEPEAFEREVRRLRRHAVYLHGARSEQHVFDLVDLFLRKGERVSDDAPFREIMARRGWTMERRCQALRRTYPDTASVAA